jgi:hypothetical protein
MPGARTAWGEHVTDTEHAAAHPREDTPA